MPWIKQDLCTGCRRCITECPVDAIDMATDRYAVIDEEGCIRCGHCHDICPREAVRHDGERIPNEVIDNLQWVRGLLRHFDDPGEQSAFMGRMMRFFNKEKTVSERTLAAIDAAQADPAGGIDAAIRGLSVHRAGP